MFPDKKQLLRDILSRRVKNAAEEKLGEELNCAPYDQANNSIVVAAHCNVWCSYCS